MSLDDSIVILYYIYKNILRYLFSTHTTLQGKSFHATLTYLLLTSSLLKVNNKSMNIYYVLSLLKSFWHKFSAIPSRFLPPPWDTLIEYLIVIIMLVSVLTSLMRLWQKIKPKKKIEEISKVKGKHARSLKKEARFAEKENSFVRAGDLYSALGKIRKALELYKKGGAYNKAGELLIREGNFKDAITLWESSGNYNLAATHLAKEGQYERAALNYAKSNNFPLAAEMYEKCGNHEKAGEFYYKAGFYLKAASNYEKAGIALQSARAYEKHFGEIIVSQDTTNPKRLETKRDIARRAGQLYLKAGKKEEAVEIFLKGAFKLEAANILEEIGETSRAARLYEELGRHEDAARLLSGADDKKAKSLKAEALRNRGMFAEAAKLYEEVGDLQIAGDLYLQGGMKRQAAEAFFKAGYFSDAGVLFTEIGDLSKAGLAYESARDYESALKIFKKLQDVKSYIRCLVKKGEKLEAGKMLLKMGKLTEAYGILQEIAPEEEGFREACLIMARMHTSAGREDSAIQLIQRGIQGEAVKKENLELYYELGRLFEKRKDFNLAIDIYSQILVEDIAYKDVANRARQLKDQLAFTAPTNEDQLKTLIFPAVATTVGGGRYKIIEELGRGGMGVVYKAHDSVLDRTVAYKVLPKDLKNHPKIVESLLREARALAKLHHPNIVTVFDGGQSGEDFFFVMEFVEGKNLREIVNERGTLLINEVVDIAVQTARALSYAHKNNIMHRDIKTSNVMISKENTVKLMDFGLAKVLGEATAARTAVSGTPYYMSPEQTLGSDIDHRTDIYSFGVMLFELLTGRVPFKEGNVAYHHLHTPPPAPKTLRSDIPPALEKIVLKCLEKDKEKRYQSADDVLKDLENCQL